MKRTLLVIFALLPFLKGFSQLTTNYPSSNVVVQQGTYTDLGTNGTSIAMASSDDAISAAQPIGFNFTYNGVTYTDFTMCTNGYIKLGTVAPSSATLYYTTAAGPISSGLFNSSNSLDANMIVPLGFDLVGNANAEYRVYTSGAVGSRVCTIQWKNVFDKNVSPTYLTQFSNMEFQVKLFETSNIIQFVYGTWTGSANASVAKFAMCGLKGTTNAATELVTVTKGSVTIWSAATAANGNYTGNALNFGNPPTRPAPVAGISYIFVPTSPTDLGVSAVYTFGKIPKAYVSPQYVRGKVKNNGTVTQTNFKVALTVSGANTYTDTVVISTLAPGVDSFVNFPGYTSINNGSDLISISVPSDNNNYNQTRTYGQLVNDVIYSYADPLLPAAGGVGFTGATGDFCAKFPYAGVTNTINQLGVTFAAGGVSLKVGIWSKGPTGLPATLLWSSNTFTSVGGLNTVPVNPPVTITDTFFAGVVQTSTSNANFGYQNETPIRDKTFYYTSPTGSSVWTDFSASSSNFRFMVEPRFQSPNDLGMTSVDYPCKIVPLGQAGFYPLATAFNYGLVAQTNVPVTLAIYDAFNTQVYTSSTTISSIAPNTSSQVNFPTFFAPTLAGNYVIKTWTSLAGDASAINDTSASTLAVVNYGTIAGSGTRINFDGVDDYSTLFNDPTLNPFSTVTLEAWVNPTNFTSYRPIISKDSSATARAYNLAINTSGFPEFSIQTATGLITATGTTGLTAGAWTHLAASYDGTTMKIYVNGALTGTALQTGSITSNNGPLYLGKSGSAATFFIGGLDEVKIWASARSESQIRLGMHKKYPDFSEVDMVCNLHFDEGVGNFLIADASGNCNNATLINMDVQNVTVNPVWYVGTIPFGTPVVETQTVTASGTVNFTNSFLSMNFANYVGSEDYYVHMLNEAPPGTQPTASPGGVTATHPRTWVIYQYGTAVYTNAAATFGMLTGSLPNGVTNGDIKLFNRGNGSGLAWTLFQTASAFTTSPVSSTYNFTSPSQFNQQFVIGTFSNPLSVKLISFTGRANQKDALLNWSTSNEEDMDKYILERSIDGSSYATVAEVNAKGGLISNNYSYIDREAGNNQSVVFYRLKMMDKSGAFSYSKLAIVQFGEKESNALAVNPNPFTSSFSAFYYAKEEGNVVYSITDLRGNIVEYRSVNVIKGTNELNIQPSSELASGVYMMQIMDKGNKTSQKIIKN
jgi:hypothetical protein